MTESTTSAGQLKFKAPASDEWCALPVDGQDKDQQEKTKAARETLKETLLASLQMQHIVVLAGSGTSIGPVVGGPSMNDLWDAAIGKPPKREATDTAKKIRYDLTKTNIEEFLSKSEAYLQGNDDDKGVQSFVSTCKAVVLDKCSNFRVSSCCFVVPVLF